MSSSAEKTITVFGSSRPRPGEPEYILAYDLGRELAHAGMTVCNGGYGGIMEASARGAKLSGGKTIGVISNAFPGKQANQWIDTVQSERTLIDRMMKLIDLGDAFVILKGGTGTLLELSAVWEFMNKGLMPERPILTVGNFWTGVVETLKDELAWEGLQDCRRFVTSVASAQDAVQTLRHRFTE